jgi:hypothetical protein
MKGAKTGIIDHKALFYYVIYCIVEVISKVLDPRESMLVTRARPASKDGSALDDSAIIPGSRGRFDEAI